MTPRKSVSLPSDAGETLIETIASMIIVGIIVIPLVGVLRNSLGWMSTNAQTEEALAIARQEVNVVRNSALTYWASAKAANPTSPSSAYTPPPAPASSQTTVNGIAYTVTVSGPTVPSWATAASQTYQWMVTVTWNQPGITTQHHLSLTSVIDPSAGS